jgi:hypothetical protein
MTPKFSESLDVEHFEFFFAQIIELANVEIMG